MSKRFALVRKPAESLADGMVTFVERRPVDLELARRQWAAYVAALEANGWPTVEVDADDTLPDSVFVEDTVVMFGPVAVLTNPSRAARHAEVAGTGRKLRELGLEPLALTEGHLDGGDVLKVGRTVYVGLGGTSDRSAIDQLRRILRPRGWTVVAVPVTKALHLKSALTALPDGTIIGYGPLVDDPSLFPCFLDVPEEPGAHVVVLDDDTVLMSDRAPETESILRSRGLRVVPVDISEYQKLEGCVTCLSVRVRQ
ncbi:dimethylargininase [Actinoplanes couchii]|uniref:N(G),N(G)-dimethylarginine dimethylaminohydrolase n=1 Tax=Actinoplanes couchii TaxID=403638 RepID=A0ABQ3XDZ4_9ACTN|nr:dimethylargininase [Actinoplanes couchii]MDR6317213.1 dimethylargininase [Actinoplanes couchii]GID56705.1 N(G),N(G)-dimethylarginine dimethylaminohydrolase [Actinoplanes couchii]